MLLRRTVFPALLALGLSVSACHPQRGPIVRQPLLRNPIPRYSTTAYVGSGLVLLVIMGVICAVEASK